MKVAGEDAARYVAIDLWSYENAIQGKHTLLEADEETGKVVWMDSAGQRRDRDFGPRRIRLRIR